VPWFTFFCSVGEVSGRVEGPDGGLGLDAGLDGGSRLRCLFPFLEPPNEGDVLAQSMEL